MKSVTLFFLLATLSLLRADDALFFGNSFTNHIPAIVADIAQSKGVELATQGMIKNGQGLDAHLAGHSADDALRGKPWNAVILQDYSLNATHARDPRNFMRYGELFYNKIAEDAPAATIVLYETWAYQAQHPFITGAPASKSKPDSESESKSKEPDPKFASADEMYGEIHRNYAALQSALQAKDPHRKVLVAPVGTAFVQCIRDHPSLNLYATDLKHPSAAGDYLAACVLYATITGDTPVGAASPKGVPDADANTLQKIALAVTAKK